MTRGTPTHQLTHGKRIQEQAQSGTKQRSFEFHTWGQHENVVKRKHNVAGAKEQFVGFHCCKTQFLKTFKSENAAEHTKVYLTRTRRIGSLSHDEWNRTAIRHASIKRGPGTHWPPVAPVFSQSKLHQHSRIPDPESLCVCSD